MASRNSYYGELLDENWILSRHPTEMAKFRTIRAVTLKSISHKKLTHCAILEKQFSFIFSFILTAKLSSIEKHVFCYLTCTKTKFKASRRFEWISQSMKIQQIYLNNTQITCIRRMFEFANDYESRVQLQAHNIYDNWRSMYNS